LAIAVDNLSTEEDDEGEGKDEEKPPEMIEGVEEVKLGEGETKIAMDQYYMDEYEQYAEGRSHYGDEGYPIPSEDDYYQQEPSLNVGGVPLPARPLGEPGTGSNPVNNDNCNELQQSPSISSNSSQKKTKPMPKESSFFVFSSKNR
jgi:hypothetical protein